MSGIVREKRNSAKSLENFAKHIEERLRRGKDKSSMELLICRLLMGEDVKVAAMLAGKWVEWRYGKAKETHEVTGPEGGPVEHQIRFVNKAPNADLTP